MRRYFIGAAFGLAAGLTLGAWADDEPPHHAKTIEERVVALERAILLHERQIAQATALEGQVAGLVTIYRLRSQQDIEDNLLPLYDAVAGLHLRLDKVEGRR